MKILLQWVKTNSIMLINAGSLMGTSVVTSMLGFVYWWVAARQFPPEAVGIASASVSAMTLLGSFCILGLGTLLITELPRQPGHEGELISTALIVVGGVGGCVGVVFSVVASYISPGFKPLGANILDVIIFASGVSLTAITLVLDQALIGLLLGELQFWRNTLFALTKLAALFIVGLLLSGRGGITIYATWAMGNMLSLIVLTVPLVLKKGGPGRKYLPQWGLLRKLGSAAMQHHFLNITLQLPTSILPVLVTALLSAKVNAWFYVSWMIVSFAFYVPTALTMVLHAMNSAQQSTLAYRARATINLALVASALATCLLQFAAKQVLGVFGSSYADQAAWTLRILVLAAFPLVVKNHYISICRIQDRIKNAMLFIAPASLLELCAAALGGHFGGLTGLSIGWVTATYIETMFMLPTVYKAIWITKTSLLPIGQSHMATEAIWLVDTSPLPAISQGYAGTQASWFVDTSSLPAVRLPAKELVSREVGRNRQFLHPYGTHPRSNDSRQRLKPPQLQPYTSHTGRIRTTDPLNVLMVTARYFPYIGGIETHVHEVGRRLAGRGISITILTTAPHTSATPLPEEEVIEGMRIIRVRAWPPQRDYYIAPEMFSLIKDGAWDLVHCQGCHTFVPPLAMLAAKEANIPYIVTFHTGGHSSSFRNTIRSIQWKLLHPLLAHASTLIGVSRFEADYFRDLLHLPATQFAVIPNGATLPGLTQLPARTSAQTLIVSVGRLERYKGHQRLITALPNIREWRSDARLLILGAGPYEAALRKLAQRVGVAEHVEIRVVPAGDRSAMAEILSQAALVALLSEYEAHPVAVMEALALRRPVLVAETSGLRELAEQGLVRAITLHSSPEEVALAARQQIEEPIVPPAHLVLPTWDDCAGQLQLVYNALVRREKCAS